MDYLKAVFALKVSEFCFKKRLLLLNIRSREACIPLENKKKMTLANQNGIMAKGQGKKIVRNNLLLFFFIKKYKESISSCLLKQKCFEHKNNKVKRPLLSKTILFHQYNTSSFVSFHKQSKGN